jgi:hypothetical protein
MNRRDVFRSLLGMAACYGLTPQIPTVLAENNDNDDHQCGDSCFYAAETVAREIIKETGHWKIGLHDWSKRRMVVTQCGNAACEVRLASPSHYPYWEYCRRRMTSEERASFRAEYGRSHQLILCFRRDGEGFLFRGFVLNGRQDGWNLSMDRGTRREL